jgi:hypothetical protein
MNGEFDFVYVNQDGSVRELSANEREYLSKDFSGGDGDRPLIKTSYESRDGWASLSGFMWRNLVPKSVRIEPVHPQYDSEGSLTLEQFIAEFGAGDVETATRIHREQERDRERLARHPGSIQNGPGPGPTE